MESSCVIKPLKLIKYLAILIIILTKYVEDFFIPYVYFFHSVSINFFKIKFNSIIQVISMLLILTFNQQSFTC